MKGGRCCFFETGTYGCTQGLGHEKQNNVIYTGRLDNIYIFLTFHALKHMDELGYTCYNVTDINTFILSELPQSTVALNNTDTVKIGPVKKKLEATILHENPIFEDCINNCRPGIYTAFCFRGQKKSGRCVFFGFEKEDDNITIFTLGNCNTNNNNGVIKFASYFSKNITTHHNVLTDTLDGFPLIDKKKFISQQQPRKTIKKSKKLVETTPEVTPEIESISGLDKMSQSVSKKTSNSQTRKKTNKMTLTGAEVLDDIILETRIDKKKIAAKIKLMGDNIIIDNLTELSFINECVMRTTREYTFTFFECTFTDEIDIPPCVHCIKIIGCRNFPLFSGTNNVVELVVMDSRNITISENVNVLNLRYLLVINVGTIDLINIRNSEYLLVFGTNIRNIDVISGWMLKNLGLFYTNIVTLPRLPNLEQLDISTSLSNKIDLRHVGALKFCNIQTSDESSHKTCFVQLSDELKEDIKRRNERKIELFINDFEKHDAPQEYVESFPQNLQTLVRGSFFISLSNYLFSETLIYSKTDNRFLCEHMNVFNIDNPKNLETKAKLYDSYKQQHIPQVIR